MIRNFGTFLKFKSEAQSPLMIQAPCPLPESGKIPVLITDVLKPHWTHPGLGFSTTNPKIKTYSVEEFKSTFVVINC